MEITTYPLGPLQTNGFLLVKGGEAIFLDPGGDPAEVLAVLKERNLNLTHIVNTHLHCDHIYGNAAMVEATGATILACPDDEFLMETEIGAGGFMGLPMVDEFRRQPLEAGETTFLGEACTVLATPGHTPGSLSLYFPSAKAVFVGDLIFNRSIGRTDFPGGSMETLMTSVREKIFTLPDDTDLYSGHGPATTVGGEKMHNPYFMP